MFSSSSYAEWTKVSENARGTLYADYERIRKHDGYFYWWDLIDFVEPTSTGMQSTKVYKQGDCKLFRIKVLSYSFHNEPMGGGTGTRKNVPDKEWNYPTPNSSGESVLQSVCNR